MQPARLPLVLNISVPVTRGMRCEDWLWAQGPSACPFFFLTVPDVYGVCRTYVSISVILWFPLVLILLSSSFLSDCCPCLPPVLLSSGL